MKRTILCIALTILSLAAVAAAQTKPRTVKDFYLQIPAEFFPSDAAKRARWIDITDEEGRFLSLEIPVKDITGEEGGPNSSVFGEIKLFKRKNGATLLGQSITLCDAGVCQSQARLLEYNNGKWKDVSEELLPKVSNEDAIKALRDSVSYDKPLKDGEEIPLVINFTQGDNITYGAAIKPDGRTLSGIKTFAWDGEQFNVVTYEEGP
jgi:hypothetical protein